MKAALPVTIRTFSALMLLTVGSGVCLAQLQDERAVRAAYIFNVTKYVEWSTEDNNLNIGFFGDSETGSLLGRTLDGKLSGARRIRVILFPAADDLARCHMIYIAESNATKVQGILDKLAGAPVMTIGESEFFIQEGGMIALVKTGDTIQMQVNLDATQRAGFKIAPQLLNAAVVKHSTPSIALQSSARRIVERMEPTYPALAEKIGLHGTVRLKVVVASNGRVRTIDCLGGHPVLAESAVKAVKDWRFQPTSSQTIEILELNF
jgi:TonB family protein